MNFYLLIGVCVAGCLVANALPASVGDAEWTLFKQTYGKQYESHEDDLKRREIFGENKRIVDKFNVEQADEKGFSLGISHLSDWTQEETARLIGVGLLPERKFTIPHNDFKAQKFLDDILISSGDVPEEVDWRKVANRVSPVKDQGLCRSGWAFASAGALEAQETTYNKSLTRLHSLSAQYLIDCVMVAHGCDLGLPLDAFIEVNERGGIPSDGSYPYESRDGQCRLDTHEVIFTDSGYSVLPEGDEETLKKVVARFGPVSALVVATKNFKDYKTGILDDETCGSARAETNHSVLIVGYGSDSVKGDYWIVVVAKFGPVSVATHATITFMRYKTGTLNEETSDLNKMNHGVLIVGYGTEVNKGDYWIANSWAKKWGEKGYVRMSRNK